MKRSEIDKWGDYDFTWLGHGSFFLGLLLNNFAFYHPKPLFVVTCGIIILVGFFNSSAFALVLPLVILFFYHYVSLKKLTRGIKLKRKAANKSQEEKSEKVIYEFSNPYDFDYSNFIVKDQFTGQAKQHTVADYTNYWDTLKKHTRFKSTHLFFLNNGMGKKYFGPAITILTDSMGLHRLKIVDERVEDVDVYPKVYATRAPKTLPNELSIQYGLFDSVKRGENVNFYKTREYRPGDSINKINWKLSQKSHKTIINEFENNSNSNINIILIDDQRLHAGEGGSSTFEYCKDIVLSLCHEHIRSNNTIGFFSHQKFIKALTGRNHLVSLEIYMAGMELKEYPTHELYHKATKVPDEVIKLEKSLKHLIKEESNTYIVTGFIPGKLWDYYLSLIKTVARESRQTHLVVVDALNELRRKTHSMDHTWIARIMEMMPGAQAQLKQICKSHNIYLTQTSIDSRLKGKERVKNAYQQHKL